MTHRRPARDDQPKCIMRLWRAHACLAVLCSLVGGQSSDEMDMDALVDDRRARVRESYERHEELVRQAVKAGEPRFAVLGDAAYSHPERVYAGALRMLHDPPVPTRSVLLVPGTAYGGAEAFNATIARAIRGDPTLGSRAVVATLELPGLSLDDIQDTAEFVAYGLRALNRKTGQAATVVSWSQGSLNVQWAFKYFPSTLTFTHNLVTLAPLFGGTTRARLACIVPRTCSPAILQQKSDSNLVRVLAADCNGKLRSGRSTFVPTTVVASTDDGVVVADNATSPSYAISPGAAPVSTIVTQQICPSVAVSHGEVLVKHLPVAVVLKAIERGGAVAPSMLQLGQVCGDIYPGLDKTNASALNQVFRAIKVILNGVLREPPLRSYAC